MKKYLTYTALILLCIVALMYANKIKKQYTTAQANVKALNSKVDSLKNKEGEWYLKTETLQYTISELKSYNNELLKEIKSLRIKPKNVEYVSTGEMIIHVSDTVYMEADDNGIYYGQWSDPWTNAYFECKDSVLKFDYTTQDSLMLVLYGQKEKFNIFHPFRKRKTSYYSVAKLTRPNSILIVKSIKFK